MLVKQKRIIKYGFGDYYIVNKYITEYILLIRPV